MSLTAWALAGDRVIEDDEEERLVERAKSDREARGELYRQHYSTVPFRAWLYRLAITQLSRWARRRRRLAEQQLCDMSKHEDLKQDDTQLDSELAEIVLLTLPQRFQTVLTLHYLAEMSVKEIADVLNCRLGTVKSRLSRGRNLMRERLSKKGP